MLKIHLYLFRICLLCTGLLLLGSLVNRTFAQDDFLRKAQGRFGGMGGGGGTGDSIQHRTGLEDSITIRFRYLDTTRMQGFDSLVYDFYRKIPAPWTNVHLGNFGTASRSLTFAPNMTAGWDHGFHAYDIYNFKVEETRFYNTTRPYSELNYMLGSKSEQFIRVLHTQNIRPNWNVAIEYRLVNSAGIFRNQNTNHNNYRVNSWYQSKNKRYQNFIVVVGNKLQGGENGGILRDAYLDSSGTVYDERAVIPVRLGSTSTEGQVFIDPFKTQISTGTYFTSANFLMRQQYDLGQKDSIVTDSSVIPLFYPRLRLEHTISYNTYNYRYKDEVADSTYYDTSYAIHLDTARGQLFYRDYWKVLNNDFSIYTFPDAKNAQQFLKLGAMLQTLKGSFDSGTVNKSYYNFLAHAEYRNKTRNQRFDIEANGNFYVNGLNAGDYNAYVSLKGMISRKLGYMQLGFQNTNRTPSYIFDPNSSFHLDPTAVDFKKENITNLFAAYESPRFKAKLSANYFLVTNYSYFSSYYQMAQAATLFNVLQVTGEKIFKLGKRGWNWKTWIILQQRLGDGPVNVPLVSTRNQIGYDGNLGFKNLLISFGLEGRYFTAYKAPGYSPLVGQFTYQDTVNVKMKRPDLSLFLHFRIKTFTAYVRGENINTFNPSAGGFTKNNVPTINYPYPGLQIRVGIFWSFVN